MSRKTRPRETRSRMRLPRPIHLLLELAERGTAANRRECLRLAELELPSRFPTVVRGSRQALLRRTALNPRLAAELRRQCLVELLFGLSVGTQVQQALEVRVSRPRRRKIVQKTDSHESTHQTRNTPDAAVGTADAV